jgi:hypothetical protein
VSYLEDPPINIGASAYHKHASMGIDEDHLRDSRCHLSSSQSCRCRAGDPSPRARSVSQSITLPRLSHGSAVTFVRVECHDLAMACFPEDYYTSPRRSICASSDVKLRVNIIQPGIPAQRRRLHVVSSFGTPGIAADSSESSIRFRPDDLRGLGQP